MISKDSEKKAERKNDLLAKELLKKLKKEEPEITSRARRIVIQGLKNEEKIRETLDSLLDLAEFGLANEETTRLIEYYAKINSQDAKIYQKEYKTIERWRKSYQCKYLINPIYL
jgi:hypothetical protein